ncbi:AAA family ATPase [Pseudonocardia sp. N23]|uniref:AAA family ATPase n=1 Tax=Pseudonocardia sp. N23 TaxID=1987376 RepID=UPI000BFDB598|nr:AAA family ATPase [Pseudonocardia sp. N23]GAY07857.1 putative ATP/GTP binding protein [Pseudonocardia sp. N23]
MTASLARPAPLRLPAPGRTLVLVAGLPGAGKSTLLAGVAPAADVAVLDSQRHRAAASTTRLPYGVVRPLVHLAHRAAVVTAAVGGPACVVVHLPATRPGLRAAVRGLARITGRDAHLLWVDAHPGEALRGQHDRGRTVRSETFDRHVGDSAGLAERLRAGAENGAWTSVRVVDRADTTRGLQVDTTPVAVAK